MNHPCFVAPFNSKSETPCAEDQLCVPTGKLEHACIEADKHPAKSLSKTTPGPTTAHPLARMCEDKLLFQCKIGDCIPKTWTCDGEPDCDFGEDESAELCGEVTCSPLHFQCGTSTSCFPLTWKCDGEVDCSDGSDEENCQEKKFTCGPNQFRCKSGDLCISKFWRCDRDFDCPDHSDEEKCDRREENNRTCDPSEFQCKTSNLCIPPTWKCDGQHDCADGSDEAKCDNQG